MDCIKCGKKLPPGAVWCPWCGRKQQGEKRRTRRGNGQGSIYKRGNVWAASVVLGWNLGPDGKNTPVRTQKSGFKTKANAMEFISGAISGAERKSQTLSELYVAWEKSALEKLSSSKQTAYHIARKRLEPIMFREIRELTIGDLQDCIDEKSSSYYTARDMKVLLSHLYKRAAAQGDVPSNLAQYIELPELQEGDRTPFSTEEQQKLWKHYASGNLFTGYILLMIYTGMMPVELFGLKKDMIDFKAHTIIGAGRKTKKRKQTPIVICDAIEPVLHRLCASTTGDKVLRMNRDNFYAAYKEAVAAAGCRPLPPYSCRHTTATALALENISPSVIQEVMRHTKFETTKRYIHVDVSPMLEAVNKIGS